jgi:hypothetical protein
MLLQARLDRPSMRPFKCWMRLSGQRRGDLDKVGLMCCNMKIILLLAAATRIEPAWLYVVCISLIC